MRLDDRELPPGDDDSRHQLASGMRRRATDKLDDALAGDREVPLRRRTSPAVHEWLDEESGVAPTDEESASQVEFWRAMESDLIERRHVRAPAGLAKSIMSAIENGVGDRASPELGPASPMRADTDPRPRAD